MSSDATDNTMRAELLLRHGQDFPYVAISDPDWADRAALAIASDLCDRRGIKWEMGKVDDDVRSEIVTAHAEVIRVAQPGWMPIETAPKDGTQLLLWCVHTNAKFANDPVAERWAVPVIGSWIDFNGGGWTWWGMCGEFTHWMPLPPPPTDASQWSKPDRAPSEDGYPYG